MSAISRYDGRTFGPCPYQWRDQPPLSTSLTNEKWKFTGGFFEERDENDHFQEHQASCHARKWPILPSEDYQQARLLTWGSCRFVSSQKKGYPMSGISSLGGSGSNVYAWFSQMVSQTNQETPGITTASDALATASGAGSFADTSSSQSLQSQIRAAILSALQTAEQSGDSTSFQTIIKNAVDQTLQANGIETDQSQGQSQVAGGGMGGMMGMAPPPPPPAADTSTSSTSSSDGTTTDGTASSTTTTTSTDTLNQQIEAAVVSALETAQSSGDSTNFQTIIGKL